MRIVRTAVLAAISEAGRIPRSWEVKGDDQVCVKNSFNTSCIRFLRHKSKAGVTVRSTW